MEQKKYSILKKNQDKKRSSSILWQFFCFSSNLHSFFFLVNCSFSSVRHTFLRKTGLALSMMRSHWQREYLALSLCFALVEVVTRRGIKIKADVMRTEETEDSFNKVLFFLFCFFLFSLQFWPCQHHTCSENNTILTQRTGVCTVGVGHFCFERNLLHFVSRNQSGTIQGQCLYQSVCSS